MKLIKNAVAIFAVLGIAGLGLIQVEPASALNCTPVQNSDLSGCDFSGQNLSHFNLGGVRAIGTDFSGANLTGADFSAADLKNANFSQANLKSVNFTETGIDNANFSGATLTDVYSSYLQGTPSHLPEKWSISPDSNSFGRLFLGPGANLRSAVLFNQDLQSQDLSGANLDGTIFDNSNLNGVNFENANFRNVSLSGTTFENANLTNVKSSGLRGVPSILPVNWSVRNGYFLGPTTNLENCDLANLDLSGINLSRASLRNASSGGLIGNPASLPVNWSLIGGYLFGPGANLRGANLSNLNLSGVNLDSADLSNANLSSVQSGNITGAPASFPTNWGIRNGYLIGPRANLSSANLAGLNLNGLDFTDINLTNANLAGASLSRAHLLRTNVSNAIFAGANLYGVISDQLFGVARSLPAGWIEFNGSNFANRNSISELPSLSGAFKVGQIVNATPGTWPNGTELAIQWLRDGQAIPNAVGTSYLVQPNDMGHLISVRVTGTRDGTPASQKTGIAKKIIAGTFTSTPQPGLTGDFRVGAKLSVQVGAWSDEAQLSISWLRDGAIIAGQTGDTYVLTPGDLKHKISASITGTKAGFISVTKQSSKSTILSGTLPSIADLLITGDYVVGQSLVASQVLWGPNAHVSYQWFSNGKSLKGATSPSLTLVPALANKKIFIQVTQSQAGYTTAVRKSQPKIVISR